jgi:hypothetical protein
VISLVAKGLTTGEVQAHLAEIYGAEISRDTISTITDRVLEGLAEWQSRPLDPVYAVLFIDCINVKIRDGNVANGPSMSSSASPPTGSGTSWGCGPASTATARAPSSGCGCWPK